eukprot:TRINITY_DN6464_c0_g1_i1.p1 TRINITY_DN6464_c0_g1~~TRINITY_DN6464_c0_g1_i1.p1  ORF type:complete len:121 (-),score=6.34 TRINITY_DN6464_c0_g1_i1:107-469(-)
MEELFLQQIDSKSVYDKSSTLISNVNELCRQFKTVQQQRSEYDKEKKKLKQLTMSKRNLNDVNNEYDRISEQNNKKNEVQSRLRQEIGEYDHKKRRAYNKLMELQRKSTNFEKLRAMKSE